MEHPVNPEHIRQVEEASVRIMEQTSKANSEYYTDQYAKRIKAAKAIAKERGIDVATVFLDDELYYEALRSFSDLDLDVEVAESAISTASTDLITQVLLQTYQNQIPEDLRDQVTQEDLDEIALRIQFDSGLREHLRPFGELMQESTRQGVLYEFIRTFGYSEVEKVLTNHEILRPTRPLASVVAELIPSSPTETE
jgi:hypothetical protein